jgi:small-conductance mechanosensitive channel
MVAKILLPHYFGREGVDIYWQKRLLGTVHLIFLSLVPIAFLYSFDLDSIIYQSSGYSFRISTLILGLIVIQIARLMDWYTSKVLLHKYYSTRESRADRNFKPLTSAEKASSTVQYIVYLVAIMILIGTFDLNKTLLEIPIRDSTFPLRISSLLTIVLVFLVARLLSWVVTQLVLFSYYRKNEIDPGRRYAINQLVTYFIYVISIFVMIENIGIDLTVLWGGLAALLVGIGLGMQDIFKDFISGIILLSERSVEVNDVVNVNGKVGRIKKIGLRTSLMKGRDDTMLILPNSSLVSNNVMNWTHQNSQVRFSVAVGVAYGSDTELVKKILSEIALENGNVLSYPAPFIRLTDFANSSLNFELFFWSEELMGIENVISDLRFSINSAFVRNQVVIPFPQRDVWLKSGSENTPVSGIE